MGPLGPTSARRRKTPPRDRPQEPQPPSPMAWRTEDFNQPNGLQPRQPSVRINDMVEMHSMQPGQFKLGQQGNLDASRYTPQGRMEPMRQTAAAPSVPSGRWLDSYEMQRQPQQQHASAMMRPAMPEPMPWPNSSRYEQPRDEPDFDDESLYGHPVSRAASSG